MAQRLISMFVVLAVVGGIQATHASEVITGSGKWQSLSGESIAGTWSVSLLRKGKTIEGTIALTGSNVLTKGKVNGTIGEGEIAFGVVAGDQQVAAFTGSLKKGTVSGEWESGMLRDNGVWTGTLR